MLTVAQHSQREWLNARCHILELAAILDRLDHAGGPAAAADPVYRKVRIWCSSCSAPTRRPAAPPPS